MTIYEQSSVNDWICNYNLPMSLKSLLRFNIVPVVMDTLTIKMGCTHISVHQSVGQKDPSTLTIVKLTSSCMENKWFIVYDCNCWHGWFLPQNYNQQEDCRLVSSSGWSNNGVGLSGHCAYALVQPRHVETTPLLTLGFCLMSSGVLGSVPPFVVLQGPVCPDRVAASAWLSRVLQQ